MRCWKGIVILLGMFVTVSSCVDEINLAIEEPNPTLVIEAWMGNIPDETYVKIYRTSPYVSGVLNPNFVPVPVKSVSVEPSEGEIIPFSQVEPAIFRQSYSFKPVPGNKYRLVVETVDGEIFESSWETMPPPVTIQDIVAEASERQVMITSGQTQFSQIRTFADIQARVTDPGVGELGYLIKTSGIEEMYTKSDLDNCACSCYENRPNLFAGMNVISNSFFQGRDFGISLGEIPLSHLGRYYVSANVKVVTQSNYGYFSQIDQQQRNSGSIFDPAPFRIKGNIKKRGNEEVLVLGGFFLFQESTFEKLLFRTQIRSESLDLNHSVEALPEVNSSCDEFYTNATPVAPPPFQP